VARIRIIQGGHPGEFRQGVVALQHQVVLDDDRQISRPAVGTLAGQHQGVGGAGAVFLRGRRQLRADDDGCTGLDGPAGGDPATGHAQGDRAQIDGVRDGCQGVTDDRQVGLRPCEELVVTRIADRF